MQARLRRADGVEATIEIEDPPPQALQHDARAYLLAGTAAIEESMDVVALYHEAPDDD